MVLGSKSYMRKGFLIYEEMRKYFTIYEEAVSHKWLCTRSLWIALYKRKIFYSFLSVYCRKHRWEEKGRLLESSCEIVILGNQHAVHDFIDDGTSIYVPRSWNWQYGAQQSEVDVFPSFHHSANHTPPAPTLLFSYRPGKASIRDRSLRTSTIVMSIKALGNDGRTPRNCK